MRDFICIIKNLAPYVLNHDSKMRIFQNLCRGKTFVKIEFVFYLYFSCERNHINEPLYSVFLSEYNANVCNV